VPGSSIFNRRSAPGIYLLAMDKKFSLFAYLLFAILLILSVFYYQERVFYADSGYQFFKIINFEKFNIEASRYAVFLTQIPLLIAIKLNLTENVKVLALIYSVSFIILYFSLFVFIDRILKNTTASIVLLSVLIIGISKSFFYTVTETQQALAYAITLYAVYKFNFKYQIFNYLLPVVFCALSLYSHIVAIIVIPIILTFYHIHFRQAINSKLIVVLLSLITLLLIKLLLFKATTYEQSFLDQASDIKAIVASFWSMASVRFFNIHLPDIYVFQILFFIYSILYLINNKKYYDLAFLISSTILVFGFLAVTYNKHDSAMNMERAFMPLSVIICIPFYTYFFENKDKRTILSLIIQAILIFSIVRITYHGYLFKQRASKVKSAIEYAKSVSNEDKFIITDKTLAEKFSLSPSIHYWSYSFETLMYSLIEDKDRQVTIYAADLEDLTELTDKRNVFLATTFWIYWDEAGMNKKYYKLKSETYHLLE
jgi:hypothetical protein